MSFDQHSEVFHKGVIDASRIPNAVKHAHVHGEQFTGNGILVAFTLTHTPLYGVDAYVGGVRVDPLSLVGAVLTFVAAPAIAATIRVSYEYQL